MTGLARYEISSRFEGRHYHQDILECSTKKSWINSTVMDPASDYEEVQVVILGTLRLMMFELSRS